MHDPAGAFITTLIQKLVTTCFDRAFDDLDECVWSDFYHFYLFYCLKFYGKHLDFFLNVKSVKISQDIQTFYK